jgi:MYXO-CTERM domain-containing protein
MKSGIALSLLGALALGVCPPARAGNTLSIVEARLDRPTLLALGVQVLIGDDDNLDARITVRYRKAGGAWREGLPLYRVRPDKVTGRTVPKQFAGSIFDLSPDTTYEIELHAVDPDGLDKTITLSGKTRAVPRKDPATARAVAVSGASQLQTALDAAQAGDVITLAKGTYSGSFQINASGTELNPIVIRGADAAGVILDGGGCDPCNVFEVYGSFVHVERLTLQNASRAFRFQGSGAQRNVVRRVAIKNVRLGVGAKEDQQDFYICDNTLEGRLKWPAIYSDDGGAHANDDGIQVMGNGHVVCHNRLIGFGDSTKIEQDGARAVDFYGNESLSAYDNALELDTTEGNSRCFRNRYTNSYSPISFQPIYGGPAYAFRNVVINIVDEQLKLHNSPAGVMVFNNTFIGTKHAINMQTSDSPREFRLENNLFIGPASPEDGRVVDWYAPMDNPLIDYNGYAPDGQFNWGADGKWSSFAAMQAAGTFESHGVLLSGVIFTGGLTAPSNYTVALAPLTPTLASGSGAIDRGTILPNITDGYTGAAPDLGALELGCPVPIYGPRPEGVDETNEPLGCTGAALPTDGTPRDSGGPPAGDRGAVHLESGAAAGDGGPRPAEGCGCRLAEEAAPAGGVLLLLLGLALGLARRRGV